MTGVTPHAPRAPQRSHARSNRARILTAARQELSRDPDASIEDIARAAGVARRTLYGHFANRHALIAALAEEAERALAEAFARARHPQDDPATALARMNLAGWTVGDRYRMLIALGRRDLGEDRIRDVLAPSRGEALAVLERGRREGIFSDHLPAPVLAEALEALTLALLENTAGWTDPTGEASATAALIAAGVEPSAARRTVRAVLDAAPAQADSREIP